MNLSLDAATGLVLEKLKQKFENIREALLKKNQEIKGSLKGLEAKLQVQQKLLSYSDAALWKKQSELKNVIGSITQGIEDGKKVCVPHLSPNTIMIDALDIKKIPRNRILDVSFDRRFQNNFRPDKRIQQQNGVFFYS